MASKTGGIMSLRMFFGYADIYDELYKIRAAFVVMVLGIVCAQVMGQNYIGCISNWLVPDGLTYYESINALHDGSLGFDDIQGGQLVHYFYYCFAFVGFFGFFFANFLLLVSLGKMLGSCWMVIGLILFPYYILSLVLPSKDLMVLFLVASIMFVLSEGRRVAAFILILVSLFVRDGAGLVMFAIFMVRWLFDIIRLRLCLLLVLAMLFFGVISEYLSELIGDFFMFSRNQYLFETLAQDKFEGLSGIAGYFARLFLNGTNLAFRTVFLDIQGGVSFLAVAYFISGLSLLVDLIYSVMMILKNQRDEITWLSISFLISLLVISVNPFVQPRYQFPLGFLLTLGIVVKEGLRKYLSWLGWAMLVSACGRAVYVVNNISLPPLSEVNVVDVLRYW